MNFLVFEELSSEERKKKQCVIYTSIPVKLTILYTINQRLNKPNYQNPSQNSV